MTTEKRRTTARAAISLAPAGYGVRKDVRNNPVREVDAARQREMWRSVGVGVLLVLVLLFSAWQRVEQLRYGYLVEQLQRQRAAEEDTARHLRLEIETLRAPARIERLAVEQLNLVSPEKDSAIVIERVAQPEPPPKSVIARR
jgi:cell division protein FtsL